MHILKQMKLCFAAAHIILHSSNEEDHPFVSLSHGEVCCECQVIVFNVLNYVILTISTKQK